MKQLLLGLLIYVGVSTGVYAHLTVDKSAEGRIQYIIHSSIVKDISEYAPLRRALKNARAGDLIHIIIKDNRGGFVTTMLTLQQDISNSKGRVLVLVQGNIASAASNLAFSGDVAIIPYTSKILFHTGSFCPASLKPGTNEFNCAQDPVRLTKVTFPAPWGEVVGMLISIWATDLMEPYQERRLLEGEDVSVTGESVCLHPKYHHPFILKQIPEFRACAVRGVKSTGYKKI